MSLKQRRRRPTKTSALRALKDRGLEINAVIDVGAQYQTEELIDLFGDKTHVLFEPVAEFAPYIAQHYAEVDHVLIEAACAEAPGTLTLRLASLDKSGLVSHSSIDFERDTWTAGGEEWTEERPIPVVRVDDELKRLRIPGPYLLKIDVDGVELSVLAGCTDILSDVAVLVIEAQAINAPERIAAVVAQGFSLVDVVDITYYDGMMWQADFLFVSKALAKTDPFKPEQGEPFDFHKYQHT
jgi:FkbM family methyltransferase